MKVVFFGGGSFRTLPIVRAAMRRPEVLAGGEIQLLDLNLARAETVGRLIQATPECRRSGCRVSWTDQASVALPGADLVSVSMPVGGWETCALSEQASRRHGFIGSDQLSVSGAFRSLTGGRIVLDLARQMERHCPRAWLVCFANPVAVYSGMVNNHTAIRALGVCGGFANHRYDLSRLLGVDAYREGYEVASAGVNHCSVLLRGTYHGEDVYKLIADYRRAGGKLPAFRGSAPAQVWLRAALRLMHTLLDRTGHILFSLEGDGLYHFFPDEILAMSNARPPLSRARLRAIAAAGRARRAEQDAELRAFLSAPLLDDAFWAGPGATHGWLAPAGVDLTAIIISALSGATRETFAASHPSRGAVRGIKDRTVVEYTVTLDRQGLTPAPDLAMPDSYHGMMAALATHQTMLGDACATADPQLFAQALLAYPVQPYSGALRRLSRDLLRIHQAEIAPVFQQAKDYL
jgi:alpha-galactosidase/6-phospho-beta-glucosidase family protein